MFANTYVFCKLPMISDLVCHRHYLRRLYSSISSSRSARAPAARLNLMAVPRLVFLSTFNIVSVSLVSIGTL
jgi:hypothetical protein